MPMSMVLSGHDIIAQAMYDLDYTFAWGDLGVGYADPWTSADVPPLNTSVIATAHLTKGVPGGADAIPDTDILKVAGIKTDAGAVYVTGTDFYLDGVNINWSTSQHQPAQGVSYTVTYRVVSDQITALVHEVARRRPTSKGYVIEDTAGVILANGKRYTIVGYQTRNVLLQFVFDPNDSVGFTIYQYGIFTGAKTNPALPPGQLFFTPDQVTDPGQLYLTQNTSPFTRNSGKSETYNYVVTY